MQQLSGIWLADSSWSEHFKLISWFIFFLLENCGSWFLEAAAAVGSRRPTPRSSWSGSRPWPTWFTFRSSTIALPASYRWTSRSHFPEASNFICWPFHGLLLVFYLFILFHIPTRNIKMRITTSVVYSRQPTKFFNSLPHYLCGSQTSSLTIKILLPYQPIQHNSLFYFFTPLYCAWISIDTKKLHKAIFHMQSTTIASLGERLVGSRLRDSRFDSNRLLSFSLKPANQLFCQKMA